MLTSQPATWLSALLVLAAPSTLAQSTASPADLAAQYSASLPSANMQAQSQAPPSLPATSSFWDNLGRHWTEADSTKQTLMAIFLICQLIGLFWFIKGSLDKIFGRRAEYRNQRTKRFARRAAIAAAGGLSKSGIPLSHQRPLYRPDSKPQLPPRPSQDHPLLRASSSSSSSSSSSNTPAQAQFQTTPAGDIVLPSWTDAGPTPLRVIVEEPEYELSPINSPATSRPHSPAYPQHAAPSPDSPNHSWAFRSAPSRDNASLRLRERGDYAALPSPIDRSSTPDTRLEDVKRPFNRPFYAEPYTAQPSSNPPEFTVHTPSSSFSPA